jgi:hypothetical protein
VDSLLTLLVDTPIPTVLVVSGVIFLFLALAGQIAGKLELPPTRQKWAAVAGAVFLGAGILLYLAPGLPSVPQLGESNPPVPATADVEAAASNQTTNSLPMQAGTNSASPSAAAIVPSAVNLEACEKELFADIAPDRIVKVENGKSSKELLGTHQTKQEPAGIVLLDLGEPILVLTYFFIEDDELFKIGSLVDGACQPLEYANGSRGGSRDVLQNWDTLEVSSGSNIYALRFGYNAGIVSLDSSEFQR